MKLRSEKPRKVKRISRERFREEHVFGLMLFLGVERIELNGDSEIKCKTKDGYSVTSEFLQFLGLAVIDLLFFCVF